MESEEVIKFKAIITYCKYYNDSSTWGVYGFSTDDDIPYFTKETKIDLPFEDKKEVNPNRKLSTLAGKMQELVIGGEYMVKATYKHDKNYGDQYNPISIYALIPQTRESQLMFLQSIISPWLAENLINAYPNVVNDVANGTLKEIDYDLVKGVREFTWNKIKEKIINNYLISDIITMLKPLGVTYTMIKKLLADEPNPALLKQQLEDNPYILCKINGIGFKKCDDLALKLKPELLNSIERLVAFIKYYFTDLGESKGHTWCSMKILKSAISNNVPECSDKVDWLLENNEFLHIADDKVGLKYYYDIEMQIYNLLLEKSKKETDIYISDEKIELAIHHAEEEQGFNYVVEQLDTIKKSLHRTISLITGKAGCVDCDTEFFNGTEWKRISDYTYGDKVLQYNKDGTAELVEPLEYIRQPKEYLWHFETMYGLDQCLSEDHNCILLSQKNNLKEENFESVMKRQNELRFYDKFITSFNYGGCGIDMSDEMLRLMVAASADASYDYNADETWETYNRARFRLKKASKIARLINLIKDAKLDYEIKTFQNDDQVNIYVYLPYRIKEFPKEWYNCSKHQLQIIAEEVMYWDFDLKNKDRYFTSLKSNADFIQFVFTSLGKRANILESDRRGRVYTVNDKDYETKSIEYTVSITDRVNIGLCCDKRKNHTPTQFEKYKTKDGFEYCFITPSHMLVLRRNNKIFVTGNCGKTSIMRAIIKAYCENGFSVSASALSAMAAQRITEATEFPAMTIHRTLGCIGLNEFTFNKDNHMITSVAFLDEGSMVNASLFLHWLEAIDDNTRIIISGDHKQLPPIGFGNVFSDLIEMFDDTVVSKLVKPMRQAEKSGILVDANLIRENINPITEKLQPRIIHGELQDMYYMFRTNRQSLFDIAVKTFLKSVETDGIDNVVIAVPRRKDCLNSTNEINKVIQEKLLGNEKKSISGFEMTFKLGAKVMQTVNDYDKNVFNGEIGYITEINERYEGKKKEEYCVVTYTDIFGKDKLIEYTKKELGALDLAYAMTVHKLQGAGRKIVIGIIDNTHHQLLDNCMLYTLLTRAKKRCLLLAEPQAFLQCIRTSHNKRNTWMMLEENVESMAS